MNFVALAGRWRRRRSSRSPRAVPHRSLARETSAPQPGLSAADPPRPRDTARLHEILSLLRCPVSGQPLVAPTEDLLVSTDGRHRWPVVMGRPCLAPGAPLPQHRGDHLSNPLCADAEALIARSAGPVLNLSAGGTRCWHPRVIEVETAVFRNTDVIADVHRLPFADGAFDAVLALNAFEHYQDPVRAAREIARVLRPGGLLFIHTAFLQPLHESPWHFFNATKHGVLQWFRDFDTESIVVSDNFNPVHSLCWFAHEIVAASREHLGVDDARRVAAASLAELAQLWQEPGRRGDPLWQSFFRLPQQAQEPLAAGFQFVGRRRPPAAPAA